METQDHLSLPLMNLSDNVVFGENFHALVRIPRYDDETEYRIGVYRAETSRRDTTKGEQVFNRILDSEHIYHKSLPVMQAGEEPTLSIQSSDSGFTYALVEIPNETFQNSAYTLELLSGSSNKPLAKTFFRSYWADMPASLLNLDIAIDHLKFILDESQLKELKSGTPEQKEKKLRAFWDQRDPTKGTVFNELMAEYYRRIDYAFEEFSNRGNLAGHESDQGKVYISYGPPDSKDRQFPPNGKVIEIWKYGNKNFVFEASTGFGDFKLVGAE
jgi:GWxTD domain-containing protein